MKKHLIAAAVAAAVAVPAAAQVTVYGRIVPTVVNTKTTGVQNLTTQSNADSRGSSAIGFRGSEDLGGGLKASFALEGDLNVNNGTGDDASGGLVFDRASFVEVSGLLGMMSVRFGRTADAIDSINTRQAHGFNLFDNMSEVAGGKIANTTRIDASLPAVKGLTATVTNTVANNAATSAGTYGTTEGGNQNSFGLTYSSGPLFAAYAQANEQITAATNDDKTRVISIGYDLGFADVRFANQINKTGSAQTKATYNQLTARAPFANGLAAIGSWTKLTHQTPNNGFTETGVAVEKSLSKRTAVFAGYKTRDLVGTGSDVTTSVVGIDHSF